MLGGYLEIRMPSRYVRDERVLMEFGAARNHGLESGNANAAADVAQEIDGARYLAAFLFRNSNSKAQTR